MIQKSYYLHKRGKVWYARIRDPRTKEIMRPVSTGQTNRTRAEVWAQGEHDKLAKQLTGAKLTLGEWADRFFTESCPHITRLLDEGKQYAETTRRQNRRYVEILLRDEIAGKQLAELTRGDILDYRARITMALGRTRSAQQAFGALRIVLREAVLRDILDADPSTGLKPIAYAKHERQALPMTAIREFLRPEHWRSLDYWRPTVCAALTGMRAGEVRALMWDDLIKDRGIIIVRHNLPCHGKDAADVKAPKWGKIRNTIYPVQLQDILEPLRQPAGFVFGGEEPMSYWAWSAEVERAARHADIPVTLHMLRHSLNTYLRGKGLPDDLLRASFGWSGAAIQDNYTHRQLYDLSQVAREVEI